MSKIYEIILEGRRKSFVDQVRRLLPENSIAMGGDRLVVVNICADYENIDESPEKTVKSLMQLPGLKSMFIDPKLASLMKIPPEFPPEKPKSEFKL